MTQVDTLITGGKVVGSSGIQEANVAILDGKVHSLVSPGIQIETSKTVDASGRYLLPGCVDCHVHTRDPGQTHKEDFGTLTKAAAVGGVTTIMCQPNTTPMINNLQVFAQVMEDWPRKAMIDFAIQPLAEPENIGEYKGLLDAGAISLEFLGPTSTGPMMMEMMQTVHENGGLSSLSVGAVDASYSQMVRQRSQEAGQKDMSAWLKAWPEVSEPIGVSRALLLTEGTPYRFHLHMITTRRALEIIRQAKETRSDKIHVETSANYLLRTEEDHHKLGHFSCILPRFKSADDNEAAWEALLDGTIDMVSTDHSPHARDEKEAGKEDIWKTPTGIPLIELSLPLMLSQVNAGRLGLPRLVSLMAETPAREYGIFPQKGTIQVGADADIVMVDMERETAVDDSKLVTAPKYSAFHGFQLKSMPVATMVRGEIVAEEGSIVAPSPQGKVVKPRR